MMLFLMLVGASVWGQVHFTPQGVMDTVYDQYGGKTALSSLLVPAEGAATQGKNTVLSATQSANVLMCSSGNFEIYLTSSCGFASNTAHDIAMRAVMCKAFQDVSDFLQWGQPSTTNPAKVRVIIGSFEDMGVPSTISALAFSLSFHSSGPLPSNNASIAENEVWKTIVGGVDSYTGTTLPLLSASGANPPVLFHTKIGVRAIPTPTTSWYTDLSGTSTITANEYDLYSVMLHEIFHALGFYSLVDEGGTSALQREGRSYLPYFGRFDKQLKEPTATAGTIPVLTHTIGSIAHYGWSFNTNVQNIPLQNPNPCSPLNNCTTAIRYALDPAAAAFEPVFNPSCYSDGSSLSHFDNGCHAPNAHFIMSGVPTASLVRYPQPEEVKVLCDLGYITGNTFGSGATLSPLNYNISCGTTEYVRGVNDGLLLNTLGYTYTHIGLNQTMDITGFMENDLNTASAVGFEVLIGAGSIDQTLPNGLTNTTTQHGHIRYTPTTVGLHLLRYVPVSANGTEGNITYIYVWIDEDPSQCSSNACNLVVNSSFENLEIANDCGLMRPQYHAKAVYCWNTLMSTPDLFGTICTANNASTGYQIGLTHTNGATNPLTHDAATNVDNKHYIGLSSENGVANETYRDEAIQTLLLQPLLQGENYLLKMYVKADAAIYGGAASSSALWIGLSEHTLPPPTAKYIDPAMLPQVQFFGPISVSNTTGSWVEISLPISTTTPNLRNLIIGTQNGANLNTSSYVLIDDVRLTKTIDDIAPVNACAMLNTPIDITDLVQLPPNATISFALPANTTDILVTNTSTQHILFTANTIGTRTVLYTLSNGNCMRTGSFDIQVSNPNITITASGTCADLPQVLTATPGGISYAWSSAAYNQTNLQSITTETNTSLYIVTITLCDGSTATASISIVTPPTPTIASQFCLPADGSGLDIGAANASGWQFLWSTGATTPTAHIMIAGYYSVTLTKNGCTIYLTTLVEQTPNLQGITAPFSTIAVGQSFDLTAAVVPMPNSYTYIWYSPTQQLNMGTGQSLYSVSINTPGIYNVTVSLSSDAVCFATASVTITAPPCPPAATYTIGTSANSVTNWSVWQAANNTPTVGSSFLVYGTLLIDVNETFETTEFKMMAGAKFQIEKDVSVTASDCHFHAACAEMWYGVELLHGIDFSTPSSTWGMGNTLFRSIRNTIEDAHFGILASHKSHVEITNTDFINCYIGIYNPVGHYELDWLQPLAGCTFKTQGQLLLPYNGQPIEAGAIIGKAGVWLHNPNIPFTVSDDPNTPNIFENLNNGIVLQNTTAILGNMEFSDIHADPAYNISMPNTDIPDASQFKGAAIVSQGEFVPDPAFIFYGNQPLLPTNLIVENNTGAPQSIKITNSDGGIWVNSSSASIYNTSMNQVSGGIIFWNASPNFPTTWAATGNTIEGGIGIFAVNGGAPVDGLTIAHNTINASFGGIGVDGLAAQGTKSIEFNTITTTGEIGIFANNAHDMRIANNLVNLNDNQLNRAGIHIDGSTALNLDCNSIIGASLPTVPNGILGNYSPVGVVIAATINSQITCTTTENTYTAMLFESDCSGTELKTSSIGNTTDGIVFSPTLLLGDQFGLGNKFVGTANGVEGRHEGSANQQFQLPGQFLSPAGTNETPAANKWALPNCTNGGSGNPDIDWWYSDDSHTMTCTNTCNAGALIAPNNPNPTYMQRIAQGSYQHPVYDAEVRKWSQNSLYETLKEKSELFANNSVLNAFMQSKDSTTAHLLYQAKAIIKNADTLSINDKTVRTSHRIATDSLLLSIKNIDIALSQNTVDTTILYAQKRACVAALRTQNNAYNNYLIAYKQQRNIKIDNAEAYNNAIIPTQAAYERNENIINRIYLSTVARGVYTFTPSQKARLDAIADACPLISGPCVFRARSMRRLYTPYATYNDVGLCYQVGISYRTVKVKEETVVTKPVYKIYPNPANNVLHLEGTVNTNSNIVCIIDMLGRTVLSDKISSSNYSIDISTIPTGLYYVQIKANEFEVFTTKLNIIK